MKTWVVHGPNSLQAVKMSAIWNEWVEDARGRVKSEVEGAVEVSVVDKRYFKTETTQARELLGRRMSSWCAVVVTLETHEPGRQVRKAEEKSGVCPAPQQNRDTVMGEQGSRPYLSLSGTQYGTPPRDRV